MWKIHERLLHVTLWLELIHQCAVYNMVYIVYIPQHIEYEKDEVTRIAYLEARHSTFFSGATTKSLCRSHLFPLFIFVHIVFWVETKYVKVA